MIDSPVYEDSKNSPPFGLQLEINKPIDNTLFMRDDELSVRLHLLPLVQKWKRKNAAINNSFSFLCPVSKQHLFLC